jgi:hypothetical protein
MFRGEITTFELAETVRPGRIVPGQSMAQIGFAT